jgi:RHH-type proline utilization regulon transcriptional repressor/proline dehydrogenase/delta 1-pyrroline-5-carboxylate dehydrogenase
LFALVRKHQPPAWKPAGAEDFLLKLMMKDEDLRYRMLRFVDVYPALRNSRSVGQHLEEYLTSPDLATCAPGPLGGFARRVGKDRLASRAMINWASRFGIERMAGHFIAGHTPEQVAPVIRRMEDDGFAFTLDLLGEFVVSDRQADEYLRRYREMVDRFGDLLGRGRSQANGPRVNISIKLTSLTSKFDAMDWRGTSRRVRERLRPLFRLAREKDVFLNVDMEKYDYRDMTLQILLDLLDEEEFRQYPHIGMVHQAYLRDAEVTLDWFLKELRARNQEMTIRLVKGAYWDSEQIWARQRGWPVPVLTDKRDTDAMYERCTRILMKNADLVRVAIASHNVRSIAHAIALQKKLKVSRDRFEVQMLYGMAGPIKDAVRDLGLPVRIYTPCGEMIPGMAYLVRRILENTSNESFLRQRFAEGVSEAKLLAPPRRDDNLFREGRSR